MKTHYGIYLFVLDNPISSFPNYNIMILSVLWAELWCYILIVRNLFLLIINWQQWPIIVLIRLWVWNSNVVDDNFCFRGIINDIACSKLEVPYHSPHGHYLMENLWMLGYSMNSWDKKKIKNCIHIVIMHLPSIQRQGY